MDGDQGRHPLGRLRLTLLTGAALLVALPGLGLGLPGLGSAAPRKKSTPSASYNYCRFINHRFRGHRAFLGINAFEVPYLQPFGQDCTLGRMAAFHLGLYRFDLVWNEVEIWRGVFDFSRYDELLSRLAVHHIHALPVLDGPPDFRTRKPSVKPLPGFYAPSDDHAFAHFAALAVSRYGPHGTFWREHPAVPYDPIRTWQIWNEPTLYFYWEPKPDPIAYTRLLRLGDRAIKAIDRHATVLTAGLPWYAIGAYAQPFWERMFKHGALRFCNGLAFHGYAPGPKVAYKRLWEIRRMLDRAHARRMRIWLTEFGWAAGGPKSPFTAGRRQATVTQQFLKVVARGRRRLRLGAIVYFDWRDTPPSQIPPGGDYFGYHMGLYTVSGRPRRTSGVVSGFARRLDR